MKILHFQMTGCLRRWPADTITMSVVVMRSTSFGVYGIIRWQTVVWEISNFEGVRDQ